MKLNHGLHLAYCTNVHRGETWPETFDALNNYTLRVRDRVCLGGKPYAIGLRLSHAAAVQLSDRAALLDFQRWLGQNHCYVFTINGFPYGQFHGTRVKEQVYQPDWTSDKRVEYTNLLFDLLAQLLPAGVSGSVSTVPCGYKELVTTPEELQIIRTNLWKCVERIARISQQTGRKLHLGLEPEPLCVLETSGEVIQFFDRLRSEHRNDPRLSDILGINYDACHLAVEFEEPHSAIHALRQHGVSINKLHLSSALKVIPTTEAREALTAFADDIYLHQVVVRKADGSHTIYRDLKDLLASSKDRAVPAAAEGEEWRIHFHIPLHSPPTDLFQNTSNHLLGVLDLLQADPSWCSHLEMETYTWEVLPGELKSLDVVDQLAAEYQWTLAQLTQRGLASAFPA
jgi:hypothetical protein